jgi:hypothetical protein
MHKLKQSLQGQVSLRGKNLVLNGRSIRRSTASSPARPSISSTWASTLKALTGPVVKLLKQVGSLFPGGTCEVFYAGSVVPPK